MLLVSIIHKIACVMLISIVLLQHGKGADLGAAFGGSGNTLFGATGADNILTRITTLLAAVFMVLSITLAVHAKAGVAVAGDIIDGTLLKDLPASVETTPKAEAQKTEAGANGENKAEPIPADAAPTSESAETANPTEQSSSSQASAAQAVDTKRQEAQSSASTTTEASLAVVPKVPGKPGTSVPASPK